MRAALRLRLLEARRRGGWWLLGLGAAAVLWVGWAGGETPDGRYGLATDLAAAFTYLAAVFFGALPLATDREKKRSYLPGASPVAAWAWALGNGLGAAAIALAAGLALFTAAGVGGALGGGIETHVAYGFPKGTAFLPVRLTRIPAETTKLRILPRVAIAAENKVGVTDSATIEVDGERYEVFPDVPITVPARGPRILLKNLSPDHLVGVDMVETKALAERRAFLLNALLAGVPPALGAAALAALAAAASAILTAPVAALLAALVLALAALKGFLIETIEYEGALRHARHEHAHTHGREPEIPEGPRAAASKVVKAMLAVLPDLAEMDRTDRVATGQWTGLRRGAAALAALGAALLVVALLGGLGVHARRLP